MGKKGGAPKADPRIGEAAMLSAQTGRDYLAQMRERAEITDAWAEEDRARYKGVFEPLQDQFIEEAQGYDTPGRRSAVSSQAQQDVRQQAEAAQQQVQRHQSAMGVRPDSGRGRSFVTQGALQTGLAAAGAGNIARRQVEGTGRQLRASVVNMGSGLAVNPGTSMGMSSGAISNGFQGAMRGFQQQGNMLNTQYQQRMQSYQAKQANRAGLFGALGTVAGMVSPVGFLSDEEAKTDKRPTERSMLDAMRDMPVEQWRYKEGQGDGGEHIGPYAQDFQKATGVGDGRSISVIDAIGATMGALKELDAKVDEMGRGFSTKGGDA